MQMRRLGNSGLMVSELSLGTMIFGEESGRSTPPDEAKQIMSRFIDAGGNFIDTANVYAGGRSEEIIGEWMQDYSRDSIILATKVRFIRGEHPNAEGLSRAHIMAEVERSLERLQTDYIDLYYTHMWDDGTPIDETLRALDDLVTQGKVRYIGVSNFKSWQLMKALSVSDSRGYSRFVGAQYQYSLLTRDIEYEFIDLLETEGLGLLPWGPLGGGFLSGKYTKGDRPTDGRISGTPDHDEEAWHRRNTERNWAIIDAITDVAEKHGKTIPQVAINWLLQQPTMCSVILGVRTMEQLEDNLGATGWSVDADDLAALDTASALPDMYPYRMMSLYGPRQNS